MESGKGEKRKFSLMYYSRQIFQYFVWGNRMNRKQNVLEKDKDRAGRTSVLFFGALCFLFASRASVEVKWAF